MGMILLALASLIGAVFAKLLADEYKAWAPTITSTILAFAARMVPIERRDRFAEESNSHLSDLPGDLSKGIFAIGCILAAVRMNAHLVPDRKRAWDVTICIIVIAFILPMLILTSAIVACTTTGGILRRERRVGRNGREFGLYRWRTDLDTKFGRLLRRSYLDELPVLLNILNGDLPGEWPKNIGDFISIVLAFLRGRKD